jgi:5-methylcytosine-specific restriction protein A
LQVGRIEPATAVDHRVPISAGGARYPALEDLASLCAPCHNAKTRCEQLGEIYMTKGCDVFGYPLDPKHPWYRAR